MWCEIMYSNVLYFIHSGVRLSPLGTTAATRLLYQLQMTDDGDCGAVGGNEDLRANRSTAPAPLYPS
jgi:urease accessory protein UreF